jgi:hypothetical protein
LALVDAIGGVYAARIIRPLIPSFASAGWPDFACYRISPCFISSVIAVFSREATRDFDAIPHRFRGCFRETFYHTVFTQK